MTGMKEKLGDKYDQWYARHRIVENQRVWRQIMEENPMNTIPEFERVLPDTYSLQEAFYHKDKCHCGSCVGTLGVLIKHIHRENFPEEPWVIGVTSSLPELPHRLLPILQAAEEAARSLQDRES